MSSELFKEGQVNPGTAADAVKPGNQTTEYLTQKSSSYWGMVSLVLGWIITIGSTIAAIMGANTQYGIIAGAIVAVAGILQKTFVDCGYIKSRTLIKLRAISEPSARW